MSKELEALQKLRDLVENLTRIDYMPTELRNEVKELLIKSYEDSNGYFSRIEEALKLNEPMRPIYEKDGTRSCPCCKGNWLTPNFKFCSDCGQKLDWSDDK